MPRKPRLARETRTVRRASAQGFGAEISAKQGAVARRVPPPDELLIEADVQPLRGIEKKRARGNA